MPTEREKDALLFKEGTIMLTKVEQNELMRLERIVEKNMQATRDWCEALCAIKDRKLYRDGYASWGDYCQRRHSISPQWANAKMLAEAVRKSETAVSLSDKAALEASKIEDSSERREILEEAAAESNGSPTAPAIRRLREKRKPKITAEDLRSATKARRSGKETVTPGQRKQAIATFGKLTRLLNKMGLLEPLRKHLEPIRAAIGGESK